MIESTGGLRVLRLYYKVFTITITITITRVRGFLY